MFPMKHRQLALLRLIAKGFFEIENPMTHTEVGCVEYALNCLTFGIAQVGRGHGDLKCHFIF